MATTHPHDAAFLISFLPQARDRLSFYLRRSTEVDDVHGEIMLACTRALSAHRDASGQTDILNLEAFCRTILENRLKDYLRRQKRRQKTIDDKVECMDTVEEQPHERGLPLTVHLADFLAFMQTGLTRKQLMALELHAIQELTDNEIAAHMNISHGAARSLLHAAKSKVRKHLQLPKEEFLGNEDTFDEVDRKVALVGRGLGL